MASFIDIKLHHLLIVMYFLLLCFILKLEDITFEGKTILIVSDVNICLLKYGTNDKAIATMLMVFYLDMNRNIS